MERTNRDIDEFLASLPEESRDDMMTLDKTISAEMKGMPKVLFEGTFWGGSEQEIIGYGAGDYTRPNGTTVDWFVVGLALQKNYISVYINAVEDRQYLSEKYGRDLGKVKVGKSSLSFASVDDIDLDKLSDLVGKARDIFEAPG